MFAVSSSMVSCFDTKLRNPSGVYFGVCCEARIPPCLFFSQLVIVPSPTYYATHPSFPAALTHATISHSKFLFGSVPILSFVSLICLSLGPYRTVLITLVSYCLVLKYYDFHQSSFLSVLNFTCLLFSMTFRLMVVAFFLIGRTSVSIRTLLELLDKRGPVRSLCSPVDIFLQVDFHSGSVSFQPHSCPFSIVNTTILPTIY